MDIDIGKNFEREAMLEAQKEAQAAVDENAKIQSAEVVEEVTGGLGLDSKTIGITAAVLVGLFLVAGFGGDIIGMFDGIAPTSAVVADVDTLHDQNIEGTLNSEEGYMYNEFSFVLLDGLWWTELVKNRVDGQGIEIVKTPLHYGPQDVEAVTNSGVLDASFDSEIEVFLAIDPNVQNKYYTLALSELNFNIVKGIGRKPLAVCTEEADECAGREILSCANNPESLAVIELVIEEGSLGEIEFDGSCVKLIGDDETLMHAADRWLLHWYSIMPLEDMQVAVVESAEGVEV